MNKKVILKCDKPTAVACILGYNTGFAVGRYVIAVNSKSIFMRKKMIEAIKKPNFTVCATHNKMFLKLQQTYCCECNDVSFTAVGDACQEICYKHKCELDTGE